MFHLDGSIDPSYDSVTSSSRPRSSTRGDEKGRLSDWQMGWRGASAARCGWSVELLQSEEAQFKLDGLILMIEGVGRTKRAASDSSSAVNFC